MKQDDVLEDYERYLLENTVLAPTTVAKYVLEVRRYITIFGNKGGETLKKYILAQSKKRSNNRTKYAFKHFLYKNNLKDFYDTLPKLHIPPTVKLQRHYTQEQVKKVIKRVPAGPWRNIAILQLSTGGRVREIMTMEKRNVDLDRMVIKILGKGQRTGYLILSPKYRKLLEQHMRSRKYLFLPSRFDKLQDLEFEKALASRLSQYYQKLKVASVESGLDQFGTHDLRRAFARLAFDTSRDIKTLQEALRHKDIKTTMRYLPEYSEDTSALIRQLQRNI